MGRPSGGGGTHPLVLSTHCTTDSRSCGCRLEKKGLSQTKELSEGRLSEGEYPVGAVVVSLASPRKASWISYNWCFGYSYQVIRVIIAGQLKMMSTGGKPQ